MFYLTVAIISEIVGTSALKASDGFSQLVPSVIAVAGFAIALLFLSFALKTVPVGIAYAIWSGIGIVAISIIGYFAFKQSLDLPAMIGIAMIVGGVLVINTLSSNV